MTEKELKDAIKSLRKAGLDDNQIIYANSRMFIAGQLNKEQYMTLVNYLGVDFNDDFKKLSEEDARKYLKKYYGIQ